MYGINLQMFNSKLRISIFDNLPKKLHFAENLQFCAKLKFRFMRNFRKKYFRFCANCAKKISAKFIAFHAQKIAQKFAKKICAKIAQILQKRFSHFVETLISVWIWHATFETYLGYIKLSLQLMSQLNS